MTTIIWIILLLGITTWSQKVGSAYTNSFTLPNTESKIALDLITQHNPSEKGSRLQIVFASDNGRRLTSAQTEPIDAKIRMLPHVASVQSPFSAQSPAISPDGKIAFSVVYLDGMGGAVPIPAVKTIITTAKSFQIPGLRIELLGAPIQEASQAKPGSSEGIALFAAAIILLFTFGSVVATLVSLLVAIFGLAILSGGVSLFSHIFSTAGFAPILAALVGLGVGIDYALFIVTRFRQELHSGASVEAAIKTAVTTSGRAVLFAGIIVCIALLGLFTVQVSFLYGVAIATALSVLVTMAAAVTLLPALLSMLGHNIDRLSLPGRRPKSHDIENGGWARWSAAIQKRPIRYVVAGTLVLAILCVPAFSIRLGSADAGNDPQSSTTRAAYDLLAKGFGAGYAGSIQIVAPIGNPQDMATMDKLSRVVSGDSGVAQASPAIKSADRKIALIQIYPLSSPESKATKNLLQRLRKEIIPTVVAGTGLKVYVGGITAIFSDFATVLKGKLPFFICSVVLLSFFLLMFLFRSILIPLKAAIMNLLSIGAAFGIVVAIFQWGWDGGILGIKGGPIEAFLPVMLFAILFGLSMDYEVFLVSRIQEEYLATGDNSLAVQRGLSATGAVITAAATIMFSVFAAFVFGGQRVIQEFGIGLAAAVAFDATVIRSMLVPALMQWWGSANWWLPKFLVKRAPKLEL
jgi:RND superfamily putative drug exporter